LGTGVTFIKAHIAESRVSSIGKFSAQPEGIMNLQEVPELAKIHGRKSQLGHENARKKRGSPLSKSS
jgi:hypothetical protein